MEISGISLFTVDLPPAENYSRSRPSTIVRVDTDEGISGVGEVVSYTTGLAEASRAGLMKDGDVLLGEDPFHVDKLDRIMDKVFAHNAGFAGVFHNEVKTALDMAFWDIMGRATGRPVSDLLGGRHQAPVPLYEAVYTRNDDQVAPEAADFRRRGFRHLMIKTGRDPSIAIERIEAACSAMQPGDIVMADAGGQWTLFDAIRVGRAFDKKDLPVTLIIEQPCTSLEDCIAFRAHCDLPVKLDESVDSAEAVVRIHRGQAADICNLQIPRLGGLTKTRRVRDLCIELGLKVVTQDRHGSQIVGAAVTQLAQSTDPDFLLNTFYFPALVGVVTADGCPSPDNGVITASTAPGLGLRVRPDVLGEPLVVLGTPAR
jgi:L-alanine-DL-glutamate epimerase-like enolase superfamily enzyme